MDIGGRRYGGVMRE